MVDAPAAVPPANLPPTHELDLGVAVVPRGQGEYDGELGAGWVIGGGVNGGYVVAVVARAIALELADVGHTEPLTVSTFFLTPSRPGPAVVHVRRLRVGGRRTTVTAVLRQEQDGAPVDRVSVTATYGDLGLGETARLPDGVGRQSSPPDLPAWDDCVAAAPGALVRESPFLERLASRLDPATVGWAAGRPSGRGVIQGWFAFADGRDLDPLALLLVVDALPPVSFDLGLPGWAPTLELTTHVRARPAPGPAVVRHATRTVTGGTFEEDCDVWDSTGRLVAQSRQLALLPRPLP